MERGVIKTDPRHTARRIRLAMQGNVIRALVELITNSDDSYGRMENDKQKGLIQILYRKDGYCGLFAVRDHAEGMSIQDVRDGFEKYGAATSGMTTGKAVRGYFGQGAKDALVSMIDGKICTFKNDMFVECRIFFENNIPKYEIEEPCRATEQIRIQHGIPSNGTIAYFKADPNRAVTVPRFDTVHEELATNYLLRKIMQDPMRKVELVDMDDSKKRTLRYQNPQGKEILSEELTIEHRSDLFPIHISIWRADKELNQIGDNREGGLLIVDEENAVLDISLFKYDNEPLASRFFGEARIYGFRTLLKSEEPVLSDERDGLVRRHPFCTQLIPEIERRIDLKVKEEKLRKQKEEQSKVDYEEERRYKKSFNIFNEIAKIEAQPVINIGDTPTKTEPPSPNGFCISPSVAQITVGKRYAFKLRIDTKVVPAGSCIKVACTSAKIQVFTTEILISSEECTGIISKYITVQGNEPNIEATLKVSSANYSDSAKICVVPEKELLLEEGLDFQPGTVTLHPNQPKRVYLLVYLKIVEPGSTIKISTDNEAVQFSRSSIDVHEADSQRHVAKYEIEVWGEGVGQRATITAECESHIALLEVAIITKEHRPETSHGGMFSEPEFNYDSEPRQRTHYSPETGKVIVYVNFPSVQHYLGPDGVRHRKTLVAQVFLADLIAETCFRVIAEKKVESSGAVLRPEGIPDRIRRDAFELSRKYGKKVHEALVDQTLLNQSRNGAK